MAGASSHAPEVLLAAAILVGPRYTDSSGRVDLGAFWAVVAQLEEGPG